MAVASAGRYANLHLAPDRYRNHASTPTLSFLQAGCPSCRLTNSIKALLLGSVVPMKSFRPASQKETQPSKSDRFIFLLYLREICDKLRIEKDLLQRAIQRKLRPFGHICRMEDNRKLKTLMFGIVDGTNKRGRPCREWMDDIVSWCKTGLQELNSLAQDRKRWQLITRQTMDTNGRWSHGSSRRRRRKIPENFIAPIP